MGTKDKGDDIIEGGIETGKVWHIHGTVKKPSWLEFSVLRNICQWVEWGQLMKYSVQKYSDWTGDWGLVNFGCEYGIWYGIDGAWGKLMSSSRPKRD